MNIVSENTAFGGRQLVVEHQSDACGCPMRVGVFLPQQVEDGPCPAVVFLSGLTCTEQNFVTKAGAQRIAAELGLVIIAPDTSPRGDDVPDDADSYDFGKGAGFYLNAARMPWAKNYNMETYVRDELTALMRDLPIDMNRVGITGHSMGGHGAITLHLKNPDVFKTCSAFAPITNPVAVPWGKKALAGYLGDDQAAWKNYDSTSLVEASPSSAEILIDQGGSDNFLSEQLDPQAFLTAAKAAGQSVNYRSQAGYDHSYFFVSTFMEDHLRHHAAAL